MSAPACLLAVTLALSLPACERDEPRAVLATLKKTPPTERRAAIRKKLARVCPVPLTDAELERAAVYVETHADDLEAVWMAGKVDLFDMQSRVCRGMR